MGILAVRKIGDGWGLKLTDKLHRTYTETYMVLTTDSRTGPLEVCLATGIPTLRTVYNTGFGLDFDGGAVVSDIQPRLVEPQTDLTKWHVTVTYQSHAASDPSQENESHTDQPTLKPPVFRWSCAKDKRAVEEAVLIDELGADVRIEVPQTSAGEPFDPPPDKDQTHRVLTIIRNELDFDQTFFDYYIDSISENSYAGYAPLRPKMEDISGESRYENKLSFYEVTYVISFKEPDWDLRLQDMGAMEKRAGILRRIKDRAGAVFPKRVLKDGVAVAAGNVLPPVNRRYRIYEKLDWGPLDLPVVP
jgi:hypothetical protein